MQFKQLSVHGWRQFDRISVDLHPQVTVLTGANGAGKSTLLGIFAKHFGFNRPYLSTPRRSKSGRTAFWQGVRRLFNFEDSDQPSPNEVVIGEVKYSDGQKTDIHVPVQNAITYDLSLPRMPAIQGIHIGSHHVLPVYQRVEQIPTNVITPQVAYDRYLQEIMTDYTGGKRRYQSTYRLKESLISMALFGEGNKNVRPNSEMKAVYDGFIEVLKEFLPPEVGFQDFSIRIPDVVLVTRSGEFVLDASSGGMLALIDFAWRIFMFARLHSEFVVTIDEPENHLHPSMQRVLLSNLVKAFPQVQFIVATHSPFIVTSVREANVYALMYRLDDASMPTGGPSLPPARTVNSIQLDPVSRAADASAILRNILGVPTTIPDWVGDDINAIIEKYSGEEFSSKILDNLRTELEAKGLKEFYPQIVAGITRPS